MMIDRKNNKKGFALLLTLIVVSVVLAIGLSLLNITLKQFTLSSTARDSEIAFHASNSGLECMQYHRGIPSTRDDLLNGGSAPSLSCAGTSPASSATDHTGLVYNYQYEYNLSGSTCAETSMYLIDARTSGSTITHNADEGLETLTCPPGVVCTTIFSRGYNRSCNNRDSIRVVQRELTIQY